MASPLISKPKIVLENGKPSEVILSWKDFRELLERVEDIYDLAEIRKMKAKKLKMRDFDALSR